MQGIVLCSLQEMSGADPICKCHVGVTEGREIVHATKIRRDSRNIRKNDRTISRQEGEITCVLQLIIDGLNPVQDLQRSAIQALPDVAETVAGSMGANEMHVVLYPLVAVVPAGWNLQDLSPVEGGVPVGPSTYHEQDHREYQELQLMMSLARVQDPRFLLIMTIVPGLLDTYRIITNNDNTS